jgi:predicted deacylase
MSTTQPTWPGSGQRQEGTLAFDLPLLRGWEWPYVTITGAEDGPTTTIIAGIHGCEYVSINAAIRLSREIAPSELRGRILVVPVVNLPAFWDRTAFVTPFDGKNPNRVFPGKATGTFSEAMAHAIFTNVIRGSDNFLDLHGGDIVEELVPFSIYSEGGDPEVAARSRAMALAYGLPYTMARRDDPAGLGGMTYAAAAEVGVAGLIAEAGGIGQLTAPDVDLLVDGARRALQVAGNLAGEPTPPPTTVFDSFNWLYSQKGGFWISDVRAGDEVRTGQRLGQILSLYGEVLETIESPQDGVVLFRTTSAAVRENGLLLGLGG